MCVRFHPLTPLCVCGQGFLAFYKGASAQFVRIASWNIVMFVTFERFKKIAGL